MDANFFLPAFRYIDKFCDSFDAGQLAKTAYSTNKCKLDMYNTLADAIKPLLYAKSASGAAATTVVVGQLDFSRYAHGLHLL